MRMSLATFVVPLRRQLAQTPRVAVPSPTSPGAPRRSIVAVRSSIVARNFSCATKGHFHQLFVVPRLAVEATWRLLSVPMHWAPIAQITLFSCGPHHGAVGRHPRSGESNRRVSERAPIWGLVLCGELTNLRRGKLLTAVATTYGPAVTRPSDCEHHHPVQCQLSAPTWSLIQL